MLWREEGSLLIGIPEPMWCRHLACIQGGRWAPELQERMRSCFSHGDAGREDRAHALPSVELLADSSVTGPTIGDGT